MKTHPFSITIASVILFFMSSCGGNDAPSLSSANFITSFSIDGAAGSINQTTKVITLELAQTDLSSLIPSIVISDQASVSPASDVAQDFTTPVTYTVTAEDGSEESYLVNVSSSIISFSFNSTNYELVKSNMTWVDAAAFAVTRNGILSEINDKAEQDAIFEALENATIDATSTVAPDGGGASYVWIGGNDLESEGTWVWDGDNNQDGTPFWQGLRDGSPVDGLYNNWGNEPDDFGSGQDGLGLALTNWPLGEAGQWNDIRHTNELFFLIELN